MFKVHESLGCSRTGSMCQRGVPRSLGVLLGGDGRLSDDGTNSKLLNLLVEYGDLLVQNDDLGAQDRDPLLDLLDLASKGCLSHVGIL